MPVSGPVLEPVPPVADETDDVAAEAAETEEEPPPTWQSRVRRSALESGVRAFSKLANYHRLEVRDIDRIPRGPALLVGNHNGGLNPVDGLFLVHYYRTCGYDRPIYVLAHDILFRFKPLGDLLESIGVVPAHKGQAHDLLAGGHKVLVFPGGDIESMRPFSQRRKIVLAERQGFVRLALKTGAPIVPVVSAGAHETMLVLSQGQRLAKRLRLAKWARLNSLPLLIAAPWGLLWGPTCALPYLPLPAKITVQIGEPIAVDTCGPAEYDVCAPRIYRQVEQTMQSTLDQLYSERLFPILG
jgi:1-acyl-sn-glycerol-3-phosphate acyltransferase